MSEVAEVKAEQSTSKDPRIGGVLGAIKAIRPVLQSDGGDIAFVEIDDGSIVHIKLTGACGSCAVSTTTLKAGIERIIMDRVPGIAGVVNDDEISSEQAHSGM